MDNATNATDIRITPCSNYASDTVKESLKQLIYSSNMDMLDGIQAGMTVGIKANLVSAMKPDTAATTHPELICALVRLIRERGAEVIIGDSPGGLYTSAYVNHVYDLTGMRQAVTAGAMLNQDFGQVDASYPQARVLKSFTYTSWLDKCDVIINFSKLKSHGMMGMSAAAKNMFGVIPGTMKPEYHFRFPNTADFSNMLVDIDEYFANKTILCIVDAVDGMEGNGPTKGTPRHIGALLASRSPHKLDVICAKLIGLKTETIPTLLAAKERGLIPVNENDISVEILANSTRALIDSFVVKDYKNIAVRHSLLFASHGKLISNIIEKLLASRPILKKSGCIGCSKCADICPAHAIIIENKKAVINRADCIHCFCCQEFCPTGTMKVHRTLVAKLLTKLT